jgi:N-acetylglutamate synthase-like GNAT family acetyltransferase
MAEHLEKGAFQGYLKDQSWKIPPDIKQADEAGKIGCLKSVAVGKDFQKMGAGRRLVKKTIEALEKSGVNMIFSIGWKTDKVHIAPILLACDFIQRASFKAFWNKESVEQGYSCPNCGHPCHCEAFLFTKVV